MKLTIFTDELHVDITEGAPVLRRWGLRHVDLRGALFGKQLDQLDDDELTELRRLLDEHGLRVAVLETSLAKAHLPDAERRAAEAGKLDRLLRAADLLDCRLLRAFNFWQPKPEQLGSLARGSADMQQVLDAFAPLAERARAEGLRLGFENCGQRSHEVVALLEELDVPGWGLAFDVHNEWDSEARRADTDGWLDRCIERSLMLHVKAKGAAPELGGDMIPWDRVLRRCAERGFDGPVSVETHNPAGSGFDHRTICQSTMQAVRRAWPVGDPADPRRVISVAESHPHHDDPVGFAVVGLGLGRPRAHAMLATPGVALRRVCDLDESRARRVGEECGVAWSSDLQEVLDDDSVEAVFVATPTGLHAKVGVQALRAGKHVLSTKPMEASLEACDELIAAADGNDRLLGVEFDWRYSRYLLQLKRAREEGFFGDLRFATQTLRVLRTAEYFAANGAWRGTKALDGGGVLSNQCIHDIDALVFVFGLPEAVRCETWTQQHPIEAEDLGCAWWRYADGLVVALHATSTYPGSAWYSRLELHGERGAASFSRGGPQDQGAQFGSWYDGARWSDAAPVPLHAPWTGGPDNFAAAIRGHAELVCDGHSGRRTQAVLSAMYESADSDGAWCTVDAGRAALV